MCGHTTTTLLEQLRRGGMARTTECCSGQIHTAGKADREDKEGVCCRCKGATQMYGVFYGMGNWLGESLWVSISSETSKGQHVPRAGTVRPDIQGDK